MTRFFPREICYYSANFYFREPSEDPLPPRRTHTHIPNAINGERGNLIASHQNRGKFLSGPEKMQPQANPVTKIPPCTGFSAAQFVQLQ